MQHANSLSRSFGWAETTVNVTFAEPLDPDLARLKEAARSGGSGVNLGAMTENEIIHRLLKR